METQVKQVDEFSILAPIGEIDFHRSPNLRMQILSELDLGRHLVVDLQQVSYIDSSAIACLVEGLQHARGRDQVFGLAGVGEAAMQVLRLTRLDSVIPIRDQAEDWLNG